MHRLHICDMCAYIAMIGLNRCTVENRCMLDICITAHETGPPHLVHIARTTKSFFWALGSINPRPSAGWATPAHLCHRHPAGPGDDFGVWWPEMVFFILLTMIPCVCLCREHMAMLDDGWCRRSYNRSRVKSV